MVTSSLGPRKPGDLTIVVVCHVVLYAHDGRIYGSSGFVRELNAWASNLKRLVFCTPLHTTVPPAGYIPFEARNVAMNPLPALGGARLADKVTLVLQALPLLLRIVNSANKCDFVFVRSPGNVGLFGCLACLVLPKPRFGKYCAQWDGYAGEPLSYRVQRWIMGSSAFRGKVFVNGRWPVQPRHCVSVYNSSLRREDIKSLAVSEPRTLSEPCRITFVGRLSEMKAVDIVVNAFKSFSEAHDSLLDIVGDGPLKTAIHSDIERLGIAGTVKLHGHLGHSAVLDILRTSDILLLPSRYGEGWPKVLMEAMLFGVPIVASAISSIPQLLDHGNRGVLVTPGSIGELVAGMLKIVSDRAEYRRLSANCISWIHDKDVETLVEHELAVVMGESSQVDF